MILLRHPMNATNIILQKEFHAITAKKKLVHDSNLFGACIHCSAMVAHLETFIKLPHYKTANDSTVQRRCLLPIYHRM